MQVLKKSVILKGIKNAKAHLKQALLALEHESPEFNKAIKAAEAILVKEAAAQ